MKTRKTKRIYIIVPNACKENSFVIFVIYSPTLLKLFTLKKGGGGGYLQGARTRSVYTLKKHDLTPKIGHFSRLAKGDIYCAIDRQSEKNANLALIFFCMGGLVWFFYSGWGLFITNRTVSSLSSYRNTVNFVLVQYIY